MKRLAAKNTAGSCYTGRDGGRVSVSEGEAIVRFEVAGIVLFYLGRDPSTETRRVAHGDVL